MLNVPPAPGSLARRATWAAAALALAALPACAADLTAEGEVIEGMVNGDVLIAPPDEVDISALNTGATQVIYLNFDGVTVRDCGGYCSDARTNQSWAIGEWLGRSSYTFAPYTGDRNTIVNYVRSVFSPYNVRVVTSRPSSGNYTMGIISPTNTPNHGVAPLDCGNRNPNDIAFLGKTGGWSTQRNAQGIAHELGHTFGLAHVHGTGEVMDWASRGSRFGVASYDSGHASGKCMSSNTQDAPALLRDALGPAGGSPTPPPPPPPATRYEVVVGDFDGNGPDDLVTVSPNARGGWSSWGAMELSSGSGFRSTTWNARTPGHMRNGGANNDYRVLHGDFNGDGREDLATITRDGGGGWASWLSMELSTGSGFQSTVWAARTPQHMRNGGAGNDYQHLVADFNGDGRDDVATITRNGNGGWRDWVSMELSTGRGFTSQVWAARTPGHMRNGGAGNDYRFLTGDFNGDGRADIATITRNGGGGWRDWLSMELSTGRGFTSQAWRAATPTHMRNGGAGNDYEVLTGDFDGDGKTDVATISRNGGGGWRGFVAMELSNGNSFRSTTWGAATPTHMRNGGSGSDYRVLSGDFDGDGRTDLATVTRNGAGGWRSWFAMELSTGGGFRSTTWAAATPTHMRNGGSNSDYRVLTGDFNNDGRTDIATITRNGGGGWANWTSMELSTGAGFTSRAWTAATPRHMRNGG